MSTSLKTLLALLAIAIPACVANPAVNNITTFTLSSNPRFGPPQEMGVQSTHMYFGADTEIYCDPKFYAPGCKKPNPVAFRLNATDGCMYMNSAYRFKKHDTPALEFVYIDLAGALRFQAVYEFLYQYYQRPCGFRIVKGEAGKQPDTLHYFLRDGASEERKFMMCELGGDVFQIFIGEPTMGSRAGVCTSFVPIVTYTDEGAFLYP